MIDKSDKKLYLLKGDILIKSYPIACGREPGNKVKDGDGRTPEGKFKIIGKRKSKKLGKIILFNSPYYPNIVIHSSSGDSLSATEGYITLKRKHTEELYDKIGVGTPIKIRD